MQFRQLLDNCEPEPEAAVTSGAGRVLLTEAIEDARQKFRIDSLAVILHHQSK